mmetsp:Transcript_16433/g.20151  ORF Transcript_16433/g.20151 Transcript_16433/m.20151 type:complete len:210 (-) Transcript_16433:89-718(-)
MAWVISSTDVAFRSRSRVCCSRSSCSLRALASEVSSGGGGLGGKSFQPFRPPRPLDWNSDCRRGGRSSPLNPFPLEKSFFPFPSPLEPFPFPWSRRRIICSSCFLASYSAFGSHPSFRGYSLRCESLTPSGLSPARLLRSRPPLVRPDFRSPSAGGNGFTGGHCTVAGSSCSCMASVSMQGLFEAASCRCFSSSSAPGSGRSSKAPSGD